MTYSSPNHYSHKLEFNLNRLPAKVSDRTNWRFLLPGIVFGFLLALLGAYELLNGFKAEGANIASLVPLNDISNYQPFLTATFFDIIFIIVGLGMVIVSVFSYIRYKKFIFDGKFMTIIWRPVFGNKKIIKENIKNFGGVRFRITFFQSGFLTKNKYIIELYHKDPAKIVPLYISTSPKNVRRKWKEYARYFEMPALINTDEGLMSKDIKNLDKSIKDMAKLGYIVDDFDSYAPLPSPIAYVRKKDKIVLKARKIVWDAYNIAAWIIIFILGIGVIMSFLNPALRDTQSPTFWWINIGALIIIVAAVFILFRKEKLVLKKEKIVNTHKYMLFSTKHDEMMKKDIESIEVTENPASGRFFVSVSSEEKTITFGSKLPIKDLLWIKKFLIHEVIK